MSLQFHPTILRFNSLPSTNTEAARAAALGAPEGLCVVAREQTAGRGRQQRAWVSPPDSGLYFSVVLRPSLAPPHWPLLTLAAAVAVSDALAQVCDLRADIKWPNDLLADGLKLCGILAETVESSTGRAVVLGIGINLNDEALPPELRAQATSIQGATGRTPHVETLLAAVVRHLASRYAQLQAEGGVAEITCAWAAASSYAEGQPVRVALDAETIEGVTRGLEPDGALRVETEAGEIKIVHAGDVTAVRPRL